jgi:hypothetical protein
MKKTCIALAVLAAIAGTVSAQTQNKTRLSPQGAKPAPAAAKPVGSTVPVPTTPAKPVEGVLATGPTPLTRAMIAEMAEALGRAIGSPLNATEVYRLEQRAIDAWKRSEGYQDSVREAHARLVKEREKVEAFPTAARPNAWKQVEALLLSDTKEHPETFLADALRRAESVAHDQYVLGDPPFSKSSAQAFFEMRDYLADLATGKLRPPKVGEVLEGGAEVAGYFQKAPKEEQRFLHAADRTWALVRAHLAASTPATIDDLKKRAAGALTQPNALDQSGRPTVAAVRTFFAAVGLTAPRADCYWTAGNE